MTYPHPAPPLRNMGCYDMLLELHRAGSLAFSLEEEVVQVMSDYFTEGAVE